MKIIKNELKYNRLALKPETLDDLWVLEKIISKGDIISGSTVRVIKIDRGESNTKVRKKIFVKLSAEKIEFNENQLRVAGKIMESSEGEHGYHSFEIVPDEIFTLEHEWKNYELEKIKKARVKNPKILICAIDYSEADFAMLTERLEILANIRGSTGKSYGTVDDNSYFNSLLDFIREKDCDAIIIAGPGFAKDSLIKFIKEKNPELLKKITLDSVSHTGISGIRELFSRGTIEKINQNSSMAEQTNLVEKFLLAIKDEKASYGKKEVEKAIELGAVDTLLISEKMVRENEELLKKTEKMGGTVKIIDSHHEAGEKLYNLGGFGAILRYKIN